MGITTPKTLRVDPELARIALGLHCASQFRLWIIARHITRSTDGSGKVQKADLKTALRKYHLTYTRQYLNSLLRQGEGLFWNSNRHTLYLRSGQFVAKQLTQHALDTCPDLLLNKAGVHDVLLSPRGKLEQWHATIYAGWLSYRNNPTISRVALEKLFNRTGKTLRQWEQQQLHHIVTPRKNYAQCASTETWNKARPQTTLSYIAQTKSGEQARFLWQLPNTYCVKGIRHHRHRGQSPKIRIAINHQLQKPTNLWRGGSQVCKLYFDTGKRLREHIKAHDGVYYLWRGENQHRHGIFEATETGWGETQAKERLNFHQERHIMAEGQVRLRL